MAAMEECTTSFAQRPAPARGLTAMRRSVSTPVLRTLGDPAGDCGMEVFVVLRNFQEFAGGMFNRLPGPLRNGVRDSGVCHYMTVFRQKDGSLVQFDFGPSAGGDIHVPRGPLARILSKAPRGRMAARGQGTVEGKVREHKLTSLPEAHLYVGRTNLSMSDIRAWNDVHASTSYELHRSDCRHYVNSLVQYTTGVERATISALRSQWSRNRGTYGLAECVVRLGHFVTDVANWEKVKAVGHTTTAVLMTLTGQRALANLKNGPLLESVKQKLLPAARRALAPVPRAFPRRPVYAVGTAAVATYAASGGQAPGVVRDTLTIGARVAGGVQSAMRAAAVLAEQVGRSASTASQQTTNHAVALATGIAGAASRGAVHLMTARPRKVVAVGAGATAAAPSSPLRAVLPAAMKSSRQLVLVASRR